MTDKFTQFVRGEISEKEYLYVKPVFKVGMRVRTPYGAGKVVHIIKSHKGQDSIGVEHNERTGGHDCQGYAKNGHGWFFNSDLVEELSTSG